jgi:hypothetical protein
MLAAFAFRSRPRALTAGSPCQAACIGREAPHLEDLGRIDQLIAAAFALGIPLCRVTRRDRNLFERIRVAFSLIVR